MTDDTEDHDLWEAYRATSYKIFSNDHGDHCIRIDSPAPIAGPLAYVTADNPGSQLLSKPENTQRQSVLAGELAATDHQIYRGESVADDDEWPVERGFWIADITREQARTIAMRYGQNAIVFIDARQQVHLVDCRP